MSVAVEESAIELGTGHGGMPARRAVVRWAWRLFRREWRQQLLVLALMTVAVAATSAGLGLAANGQKSQDAKLGTADYQVTVTGSSLDTEIADARASFGTVEVINHQTITVPGSTTGIDLRGQDPRGTFGQPMLRLTEGRFPTGNGEIAVTPRVAELFKLRVRSVWRQEAHTWSVVGVVENPLDLLDRFALVIPSQSTPTESVTLLFKSTPQQFAVFKLPSGSDVVIREARNKEDGIKSVLVLATVGLLFVGLLAVAGFTVMAQRRLRALGMLGALGASQRHIQLVMLANGAVVGIVGSVVGTAIGLGSWFALSSRLESIVEYRIDPFNVPWWGIIVTMLLAVVTAIVAAWWPARTAARVSVIAALAARPAPPRPAHRFAIVGGALLLVGLFLIFGSRGRSALFLTGGIVAIALGTLMLAPLAIAVLALVARISSVAVRLALRDLARYQARSGAALAAVILAVGIAASIVVGAAAAEAASRIPPSSGNLPRNQIMVWLTKERWQGPVPSLDASQVQATKTATDAIAAAVHTKDVLALEAAVSPNTQAENLESGVSAKQIVVLGIPRATDGGSTQYIGNELVALYVATPAVLQHYGINPSSIDPTADVISSRAAFVGYELIGLGRERPKPWQPKVQQVSLPTYTSVPVAFITPHAMQTFGLTSMPISWLVQASQPLTPSQLDTAQTVAAGASGINIESRPAEADLSRLRADATGAGIVVALGVLAMTVGLIRSGSAGDLRTLTATGAPSRTRRTLTAATAMALALLGALLGTLGAYLALIAWYHSSLHLLGEAPVVNLLSILIGLPVVAGIASWLLAGREPSGVARSPLE